MTAPTKAAKHLRWAEEALLTATGQRRTDLLAKAEHLRGQLDGRCRMCGREIEAKDSVAIGLGSHCARMAAGS